MRALTGLLAAALVAVTGACVKPDRAADDAQVIRDALDSTVQLYSDRGGGVTRAGSGIVLSVDPASSESLVLTTAHMLEPPAEQRVYALSPLRRRQLAASIVRVDPALDLALVRVEGLMIRPVSLRSEASLGEPVWVVAFPWGRERTVVSGVVSQVAWPDLDTLTDPPISGPVRLIDASVSYGMSGGGVFSRRSGALVGMVRGYRSAQLSFPGAEAGTLTLPVAGETTVIAATAILCFVRQADPPAALATDVSAADC